MFLWITSISFLLSEPLHGRELGMDSQVEQAL